MVLKRVARLLELSSQLPFLVRSIFDPAIGWAAFILSPFEMGQTVVSHERGDCSPERLSPRVVMFSHFDRHGQVRDHTRYYIDALRAEGFDVVFVTNSRRLALPDLVWVRERSAHMVFRRNVGYDFAAWRDAMTVCGLPTPDTRFLLMANDSVYGPLRPLAPVFQRIDFDRADVWGATDSWQHRFHLQSFFIAFGPKALRDEAFGSFWGSVANVRSKWWVVNRYELRMTRFFIATGLRCKALWPYIEMIEVLREAAAQDSAKDINGEENPEQAAPPRSQRLCEPFAEAGRRNAARVLEIALRHVPLNPTADLWQVLIEQGCPFLKRELLRDNPSRVPGIAAWYSLVGRVDGSGRDVILRDLEQSLKNRSP